MPQPPPILTPELATRLALGLREHRLPDVILTEHVQALAAHLRELGVGIVDIARNRAWVDERVHEGALVRMRQAETALAEFQGLMGGEGR